MREIKIATPIQEKDLERLRAGDQVYITGFLFTARDAAHKKLIEALERGEQLPFDIKGQIIYYVGPCPHPPGEIIGSAGPTTSGRMDSYTPPLLERGLKGMIGKGERNEEVIQSMKDHKAVYFAAIGGAGALIKDCIKSVEMIAYEDLGTEAIRKIWVEKFPAIVVIDTVGNNLYSSEKEKYRR